MTRALAIAAAAALALPAAASAAIKGTVVHKVSRAGTFVVATKAGRMHAVRSARSPRVGRVVAVRTQRATGGRLRATRVRVLRAARRHVVLRGVVTHADRRTRRFVLSSRGVSLLVRAPSSRGRARAAADTLPQVGDVAVVEATLSGGEIEADDVQEVGNVERFDLEGVVLAIDEAAGTLTVSADDEDESGADLTVTFPPGSDLSGYAVGDEVELRVERQADGTLLVLRSSVDEDDEQGDDDHGDDDQSDDQGDDDQGDDSQSDDQGDDD